MDHFLCASLFPTPTRLLVQWTCAIQKVSEKVEAVVRTQRYGLDADDIPVFSGGWTRQGFCRDLDHC